MASLGNTEADPNSTPYLHGEPADPLLKLVSVRHRWRIDRWTAEVVAAFRAQGVRPILLKGPAVAQWLYATDPKSRDYGDVDIVVSPSDLARAEDVLRQLGFNEPIHADWLLPHARGWIRPSDGAEIDLHRTLHTMEALAVEQVWAELSSATETCEVGGVAVEIPSPAMRTLHVVLHIHTIEDPRSQASEDLRRAIARVDRQTWDTAASLARRLGVADDMGQRLRQSIEGTHLAEELDLPAVGSLQSYVSSGVDESELPLTVYLLWCLSSLTTYRAKARWILQRQFPPRRYMVARYPIARQGTFGLIASYGQRSVKSCILLPGATFRWIRFNHRLRGKLDGKFPTRQ